MYKIIKCSSGITSHYNSRTTQYALTDRDGKMAFENLTERGRGENGQRQRVFPRLTDDKYRGYELENSALCTVFDNGLSRRFKTSLDRRKNRY